MTAVFGRMPVVNVIIHGVRAAFIALGGHRVSRLQAPMTGVPAEDWPGYHVDCLGRCKFGFIMHNPAPYLALKIVGLGRRTRFAAAADGCG